MLAIHADVEEVRVLVHVRLPVSMRCYFASLSVRLQCKASFVADSTLCCTFPFLLGITSLGWIVMGLSQMTSTSLELEGTNRWPRHSNLFLMTASKDRCHSQITTYVSSVQKRTAYHFVGLKRSEGSEIDRWRSRIFLGIQSTSVLCQHKPASTSPHNWMFARHMWIINKEYDSESFLGGQYRIIRLLLKLCKYVFFTSL